MKKCQITEEMKFPAYVGCDYGSIPVSNNYFFGSYDYRIDSSIKLPVINMSN